MAKGVKYFYNYNVFTISIIFRKRGATSMESGPQYIYILQSFVFSRENYKLSSVLSVLSCYITCIHSILMVYKAKHMVGVPSLTHIPIDI